MTENRGIPISDLIPRRLYALKSRNLATGVWWPKQKCFIGIREKLGQRYLAEEFHYEIGPPFGTAWAKVDEGIDLPADVGMYIYEPVTTCRACREPVEWSGPPAPAPWVHVERDLDEGCEAIPQSTQNKALFDWLTMHPRPTP
jgi:hypothetical protein